MSAQTRAISASAGVLIPACAGACLAAAMGHPAETVIASFVLFVFLSALAWADAATQTVPDGLTFPFILAGLVYCASTGGAVVPSLAIAGGFVAIGLLQDWIARDGGWIGSGDYLLFAGAVAWLGLRALPDLIILSAVLLGLQAIISRRGHVAMAPALSIAIAILWLGVPIP